MDVREKQSSEKRLIDADAGAAWAMDLYKKRIWRIRVFCMSWRGFRLQ